MKKRGDKGWVPEVKYNMCMCEHAMVMVDLAMKEADVMMARSSNERRRETMMMNVMVCKPTTVQGATRMGRETIGTKAMNVTHNIVDQK